MIGKLRDLTMNTDRTQNVTLTVGDDFRAQYDSLKDKQVEIIIKPYRQKRSKDANAFAWVVIDRIAEVMSMDKVDVYRNAIKSIGGVSDIVCAQDRTVKELRWLWEGRGIGWVTETMPSKIKGCTNVVLYKGSSAYDSKQMSTLIDHLLQDAENIGIKIERPEDLIYEQEHHAG